FGRESAAVVVVLLHVEGHGILLNTASGDRDNRHLRLLFPQNRVNRCFRPSETLALVLARPRALLDRALAAREDAAVAANRQRGSGHAYAREFPTRGGVACPDAGGGACPLGLPPRRKQDAVTTRTGRGAEDRPRGQGAQAATSRDRPGVGEGWGQG